MIRIRNLTRYYGPRLAVDDISFDVARGEIVGFLGPNGAGKTTTMRMITGCLAPTRGDVWVADHNMTTESLEARRFIGYLPEGAPLYAEMTTRACLSFSARLRGLEPRTARRRLEEVAERCAVTEYLDVLTSKLSRGYRQRVGLAQAIIHDPPVLVLDEPTAGIDPIQVAHTRNLIRAMAKERTILLSTHILPEASAICDRVVIIHEGRIAAQDRIQNLAAMLRGGRRIRLRIRGPEDAVTERLRGIDGVADVRFQDPWHLVTHAAGREPQGAITASLVQAGWTLLAMESEEMSLEDIFLRLTTEENQETGGTR